MSKNSEFLNKYKRLVLEYTNVAGAFDVSEDGEEDMGSGPSMGGDPAMGGDPNGGQGAEGFNPEGGEIGRAHV